MRALLLAIAALAVAAPAAAQGAPGTVSPKAARGKSAKKPPKKPASVAIDVAGAVASGDADRQCAAALALVSAGDAARGSLLLDMCTDLPARADAAKAARTAVAKQAAREQWSPVEVVLVGKGAIGAVVTIDAFADVPLVAGNWKLPAGTYRVAARTDGGETTYDLVLAANSRALVMLEPPLPPQPPRDGVLDFGTDDAPLDAPIAGPPVVKHESILPDRFKKLLKTCGAMACRKQ